MTKSSRKIKILILLTAGVVVVFLIGRWIIYPAFPIEDRHVLQDGGVRFERMNLNRLDLVDWEDGLRMDGESKTSIRHMIYGDQAVYIFTRDSRVVALMGNESGVPSTVVEKWEWQGDPHEFPYYDKKTYPYPGP
jgi:hypothetical protein